MPPNRYFSPNANNRSAIFNVSNGNELDEEHWLPLSATIAGKYFFLSAFAVGMLANIAVILRSTRGPLSRIKLGTLFILRVTAYLDIANLFSSALFTWLLNYTSMMQDIKNIVLLNFLCKFYNMMTHLTIVLSEWVLVVFAVERAVMTYNASDGLHYFSTLRLRIGVALFTVVIFAAFCNYMWMFGRNVDDNGLASCSVRPEFHTVYYKFLIYLEPGMEFLMPQTTVLVCCFLIGVFLCQGRRFNMPLPHVNLEEDETAAPVTGNTVNKGLLKIFFLQACLTICMDIFRNSAKLYSIVQKSAPFAAYHFFNLQIHVSKFCLKDILTAVFLFTCLRARPSRQIPCGRDTKSDSNSIPLNSIRLDEQV